jgi:DNA-binding CsgD family transcriptional regulator
MPILLDLTDREEGVLYLLAQGYANKQIAAMLGIALSTVQNHMRWIYTKLGAVNRVEAANAYWRAAGFGGNPHVSQEEYS